MSKVDFLSEYDYRINKKLKDYIKETWEKIWEDKNINYNKKQKNFEKRFYNEILLKLFKDSSFNVKFKILKIYEYYEDDLKSFIKTLGKNFREKKYYPKIPTAKEIYKWIIINNSEEYKKELNKFLKLNKNINTFVSSQNLPKYAYLVTITFKLKKPYISRDDEDFYIIDNPIVKDKVFKVPIVRPSTWKGVLRFASKGIKFDDRNKKDEIIKKLFGNDKEEDKNKKRGRLTFYPTFFDNISLEVITPLNRETKTPNPGPIYFETVPKGTEGKLRILYYPYDLVALGNFNNIEEELKEDFELLGKALGKMFYEIGFSAKKTSGFGTVERIKKDDIQIYSNNFDKKNLSEELKNIIYRNINIYYGEENE